MSCISTLYTPRLRLRPFTLADAPRVQELAGDQRIAATTALIPHPYPDGHAEQWINGHASAAAEGREFTFAITLAGTRTPGRENDLSDTGHLIGVISLRLSAQPADARAEIGYWMGVHYWNKGFTTEAAHSVLAFAFTRKNLHRVTASHVVSNIASAHVLQHLGMTCEGTLRQHLHKWGHYLDVMTYGILQEEWTRKQKTHTPPTFSRTIHHAVARD